MADSTYSTDISVTSLPQSIKIIWKIPDYFHLPATLEDGSLESPSFIFANAKWCIRFYPNGTYYSIVRLNSFISCHEITLICGIDNGNEEYSHWQYDKLIFKKDGEEFTDGDLPSRSELLKKQRQLVPDGTLIVMWHLFSEESKMENVFYHKVLHKMDSSEILSQDLKNLLLSQKDCDLILKVKDKIFPIHQIVMSARSPAFAATLTHGMRGKNSNFIDIPDCDPKAMEQFLLYVYSGKVDDLNENIVRGLYDIADKYNMINLKEECRDFMKMSMSYRNICDIILFALDYTDESVLEYATTFFLNNTTEILTTAKWMIFQKDNEIVANELLTKASKK